MGDILPEDFPEPYRQILSWVGMEKTIQLAKEFGGANIYFPKMDVVQRAVRDRVIKREFTGYNIRRLAIKYNLTESRIREIVQGSPLQQGLNPNQLTIFELLEEK